jgi:hypothetical protein
VSPITVPGSSKQHHLPSVMHLAATAGSKLRPAPCCVLLLERTVCASAQLTARTTLISQSPSHSVWQCSSRSVYDCMAGAPQLGGVCAARLRCGRSSDRCWSTAGWESALSQAAAQCAEQTRHAALGSWAAPALLGCSGGSGAQARSGRRSGRHNAACAQRSDARASRAA